MKLGILMTQDKSGQMGTELCSPVTYSVTWSEKELDVASSYKD